MKMLGVIDWSLDPEYLLGCTHSNTQWTDDCGYMANTADYAGCLHKCKFLLVIFNFSACCSTSKRYHAL